MVQGLIVRTLRRLGVCPEEGALTREELLKAQYSALARIPITLCSLIH